ncbi:hypothetical protein SAMN04487846_0505 [Microbacterium sp. cf046]|uniref:hypothetical protein n=1 Tax=Microbacterium sp. cf046 TaxID=1761803 RepID=UPI0008E7AE2B|nr:hypothetical protein [Microbacterium sp. cf046]SFR90978.1 hypothetical protein SAMN04487846_0505 [Microbacterium sp. cf046]
MSDIENIEPEKKGVSRRTVTKAMAWAVPAIAIAAPVPAFAASGGPPGVAVGQGCKLPGNSQANACAAIFAGIPGLDAAKAFAIPLLITNNTSKPIVLKPSITISNVSSGLGFDVKGVNPPYCTVIPVGGSVKVIVYANSDNSANQAVTFDLTIPWGHDCNDVDHPPIVITGITIDSFPPCSSNTPFPQGPPTCDPPFYANP